MEIDIFMIMKTKDQKESIRFLPWVGEQIMLPFTKVGNIGEENTLEKNSECYF